MIYKMLSVSVQKWMKLKEKLMPLLVTLSLTLFLMSCGGGVSFGINSHNATCDSIRNAVPEYSVHDTENTLRQAYAFELTLDKVCK